MTVTVLTRKRLWGRAGNRCAFPTCRQQLIEETVDRSGHVVVGDEAHIVAREPGGPRGQSDLPMERRDDYENLVLLCGRHHALVDTDVAGYPVPALLGLKAEHERWVRDTLAPDGSDQAALERYAEIVDEWAERAALDRWTSWSSQVANPTGPRLPAWVDEQLTDLRVWLLAMVWPGTLPDLERALHNFHAVLTDFQVRFGARAEMLGDGRMLGSPRPRLSLSRHSKEAVRAWRRDAGLVADLLLELTRAANHVCAVVRQRLDPQFRLREGVLLVESGPYRDADVHYHRPEYDASELGALYPGLPSFLDARDSRDMRISSPEAEVPPPG